MAFELLGFSNSIKEEIKKELSAVIDSGHWSSGPQIEKLQASFTQIYKREAVATSSGGSALSLLQSIYPYSPIAVQSNTYFASCLPWINRSSNIILLPSVDKLLMPDASAVQEAIQLGAKLVLITHIGGYPNPYIQDIAHICNKNKVILVEDCAHAPLVSIDGKLVGTFGDAAILSFFPTKPLPAGEGGLVLLKDEEVANELKRIRDYGKTSGSSGEILHSLPAYPNARMTEFSASILNVILSRYQSIYEHKKQLVRVYREYTNELDFIESNRDHFSGKTINPSFYKYICFAKSSLLMSSPVYDDSNQISSILDSNSYPYTVAGKSNTNPKHICLPVYPGMNESDAIEVIKGIVL